MILRLNGFFITRYPILRNSFLYLPLEPPKQIYNEKPIFDFSA